MNLNRPLKFESCKMIGLSFYKFDIFICSRIKIAHCQNLVSGMWMTLPQRKDLQSYSTRPEMTRGLVTLLAWLHRHEEMMVPTNKLRPFNDLQRYDLCWLRYKSTLLPIFLCLFHSLLLIWNLLDINNCSFDKCREGGFVVGEPIMPLKDWVCAICSRGRWLVWGVHCWVKYLCAV